MDFKRYLEETARGLDQEVQAILGEWLKEVRKTNFKLIPLAEAFVKACEGGKRIRGTLCKLGYQLANPKSEIRNPKSEIIKVGAAYEIFHASILAHDDIIDKSDLRRGQPTLYKALGGDHYGISQAICLADLGFFLATKLIADSNFPDKQKNQALAHFSKTTIDTALGEVLDVELPHLGGKRRQEDVIAIHYLKTAQYTVSGPLILGAILGGAKSYLGGEDVRWNTAHLRGEQLLKNLAKFGESLGIAFQIQDDILGVFGDEKELGKSTTSDIEEGKNTLLITEALKRANSAQRQILEKFYGQGIVGNQGLRAVRKVFLETRALDYSQQLGVEYVLRAKSVIPEISHDKKWRQILTEMADFLIERSH